MITVQNARMMTEKAIQKEIESRTERAKEFCETISKDIETECLKGKNNLIVGSIDRKIYSYVIDILESVGFEVVMLDNITIQIIW